MNERMKKMELSQSRLAEDERYIEMLSNARSCQVIKHRDMRWIRELTIGQEFSNVCRRAYSRSLSRPLIFRRTSRGLYRSTKSLPRLLRHLSTGPPTRGRESSLYAIFTGLKL
uniref:Uncharacterized protein n=1 Tax=Hyaloperonospora arabidopsidis (strain Emoy2) TaxID=559515 RepID=M4BZ81_HYAAE